MNKKFNLSLFVLIILISASFLAACKNQEAIPAFHGTDAPDDTFLQETETDYLKAASPIDKEIISSAENNGSAASQVKEKVDTSKASNKETPAKKAQNQKKASNKTEQKKEKIIAIDAGHQKKGNNGKEPIGPGSKTMKAKVSSGTQGVATGVPEYELNLIIAKLVRDELKNRGYEVYMIREKNDVDLSNKERADMANDSGADILLRIHADSSTDSSVRGASTLYPSKKNPYVSSLSKKSLSLSENIINALCKKTGAKNRGAIPRDDMSGINWCTIPVTIIEMGFMSNPKEDKLMETKDYREKIAIGICDGIDQYYKDAEKKK